MIESFAAAAGCFNGNGDIFFDALLADVFVETFWADAGFDAGVFVIGRAGDDSVLFFWVGHSLCAGVGHFSGFRTNSVRPVPNVPKVQHLHLHLQLRRNATGYAPT